MIVSSSMTRMHLRLLPLLLLVLGLHATTVAPAAAATVSCETVARFMGAYLQHHIRHHRLDEELEERTIDAEAHEEGVALDVRRSVGWIQLESVGPANARDRGDRPIELEHDAVEARVMCGPDIDKGRGLRGRGP
jgi:hypothetical protein